MLYIAPFMTPPWFLSLRLVIRNAVGVVREHPICQSVPRFIEQNNLLKHKDSYSINALTRKLSVLNAIRLELSRFSILQAITTRHM
jgi:hypothetical protein